MSATFMGMPVTEGDFLPAIGSLYLGPKRHKATLINNGDGTFTMKVDQEAFDLLVGTEPCPPHPSDTAPSDSQQEQQGEVKPAPHPHSEDTTGTGAS